MWSGLGWLLLSLHFLLLDLPTASHCCLPDCVCLELSDPPGHTLPLLSQFTI